jgi:hypothetical protein
MALSEQEADRNWIAGEEQLQWLGQDCYELPVTCNGIDRTGG